MHLSKITNMTQRKSLLKNPVRCGEIQLQVLQYENSAIRCLGVTMQVILYYQFSKCAVKINYSQNSKT